MSTGRDHSWDSIFSTYNIDKHDFNNGPYYLTARQIQKACQNFSKPSEKEVRILCKQDTRELRPNIFKKLGLFLLPVKNGEFAIIKGEGYVDIPKIDEKSVNYHSKLNFYPDTSRVGNSEMQHLDYAYASSLIRTFVGDDSLVLTIRGRKYTPEFSFKVGLQTIKVKSVQTEVDAGYEGNNQVVLIEAKNVKTSNLIIRQLYYPYRQWQQQTNKKVSTLFFDKEENGSYSIWHFGFSDPENYNSIYHIRSGNFTIGR